MRAALTLVAFLACGDAYLSDPIEAGLRPHHATGASVEDPLLFRHQFQDHDDSGRRRSRPRAETAERVCARAVCGEALFFSHLTPALSARGNKGLQKT